MTLLAPPLKVTHRLAPDEESVTITAHLVTYNEEGTLTVPPNAERIWGDAHDATRRVLEK